MSEPWRAYVEKARQSLVEARAVADIRLFEAAGRAAYLATYHAAQAFILARTDKVAKTHSGVRSQFARVAKDDLRIEPGQSGEVNFLPPCGGVLRRGVAPDLESCVSTPPRRRPRDPPRLPAATIGHPEGRPSLDGLWGAGARRTVTRLTSPDCPENRTQVSLVSGPSVQAESRCRLCCGFEHRRKRIGGGRDNRGRDRLPRSR